MNIFLQQLDLPKTPNFQEIMAFSKAKKLEKGAFFVQEGTTCNCVALILSGIFRSFYITPAGEEVTYCFRFPHTFLAAYSSFISGLPTQENIQAITPAEVLIIPKKEIIELAENDIHWMRFLKNIAEAEFLGLEKRVFQLQKEKAKQRYADLMAHQPEYIQNIPLQYLASYLGITQRHLSRLRKATTI